MKRPRCPHDDKPLIRLFYNKQEAGERGPVKAPWFICPKNPREHIFPDTSGGD